MTLNCPLCNSKENIFLFMASDSDNPEKEGIPIRKCSHCLIVFSDVEPPLASLSEELYFEGYYGENVSERWINKILMGIFQFERQRHALNGVKGGKILDIGCGDGTFLGHLNHSWEKYGYEPSKAGIVQLQKKNNIRYVNLSDSNIVELKGLFDVITLWQVLEHVAAPHDLLKKIYNLLKDDGMLFISIPNYDSWQAKIFSKNWFHLDPQRHIYHFTIDTIKPLLEENDFMIKNINTISLEYGIFGWWQSFFNMMRLEFNMAYKILKRRKKYDSNIRNKFHLVTYFFLGMPILMISIAMTFLESLFRCGGVINLKAKKDKSAISGIDC